MNGRRVLREYAKSKGREAKEFERVEDDYYGATIFTKDSHGKVESTSLDYRDLFHWMVKSKKFKEI